MHSPDQCDRVRACPIHQQCYIGQRESGLSGSLLWTSRCGHESADCTTASIPISGVVGKRKSPLFCSTCCSSNFCNNKCYLTTKPPTTTPTTPTTTTTTTTKLPDSKPMITYITRPHGVKIGSDLHLTCRATGNPTPTVAWNFFSVGDTVTTNAFVSNEGAELSIIGVTRDNYGHYACKASNLVGSDIRYVDVLEPGPV
ncbi:neuronal growth regulator 1-like [Pecten maximus]|uniref:neuronal growth regulator 1-like n=1 Tax=Pecten maximus TaxID=6579 RepID=UPI001457F89F|nr:neuronal growth regulator 1-like [Pecten maximus]